MGYLQEFQTRFTNSDSAGSLQLWEEYCAGDHVDGIEIRDLLQAIKISPFPALFGQQIEAILPLWEMVDDDTLRSEIIKFIIDLQVTNSPNLARISLDYLKDKYGHHNYFNEKIRLIGLRTQESFQGAIANYELLTHLDEGKYVFHTAGWGTGEIIDISLIREELVLEFELVLGRRDLSFENAFKNLIPLPNDHFLSRRFGNPDELEEEARDQPVKIIRLLLRDLGPKTAAEIKDELHELVIPAEDWTKWWQSTRAKIKKDTKIATPGNIKESFQLREEEITHEERFQKSLQNKTTPIEIIQIMYQFTRDFPETLKNPEFKAALKEKLVAMIPQEDISLSQKFQVYVFLENLFSLSADDNILPISDFVENLENIEETVNGIEIIAFKKRALVTIRKLKSNWSDIFLNLLLSIQQSVLRDYLLKELNQGNTQEALVEKLSFLIESPTLFPEAFVWFFQKVTGGHTSIPFNDQKGQCRLFESFLILFHYLEQEPENRDLVKKMYATLSGDRYACVRSILQDSSIEFCQEILLLVTKCQTLSNHDIKILHSLAEVVHPSLNQKKREEIKSAESKIIWATQEGYTKIQERIHHIGTIETVENAREIEAARALGDLRENSEYKFALEKRSRLQAELKLLSDQLNKARILTADDIVMEEVGVGLMVDLENPDGSNTNYTILGPWEADPDKKILSFQSKLAQSMTGHRIGDTFSFHGEEYKITGLKSYLN